MTALLCRADRAALIAVQLASAIFKRAASSTAKMSNGALAFVVSSPDRPVFFELANDGKSLGACSHTPYCSDNVRPDRVQVTDTTRELALTARRLYDQVVPKTTRNFRELCV